MDKILAVVTLCAGSGYLLLARSIPGEVFYDPVGPRLFPTAVAIGIIACGLGICWETVSARAKDDNAGATVAPHSSAVVDEMRRLVPVAALSALILCYALLVETAGYVIVSIVLLLSVSSYLNRGRHVQNVVVSLLLTLTVYYSFTEFLRIRLPGGFLASIL